MNICKLMVLALLAAIVLPCRGELALRPDATVTELTPKAVVQRHKIESSAPEGGWKSIGKGMYQDDLLTIFSVFESMSPWEVEIEESETTPHWYRFIPYCSGSYVAQYFNEADTNYLYINATDPEAVYALPFAAYNVYGFYPLLSDIFNAESVFGTRNDTAIEFPAGSFIFENVGEDGSVSYYYAAINGNMKLTFPEGYDPEVPATVTRTVEIAASSLNGDDTSAVGSTTIDGITISLDGGGNSTVPKVWNTGEVRMYAKNTITVTAGAKIVKIVFDVPASASNMKNRYTELHPSEGEMSPVQAKGDTQATWVGSTKSVTFTVDELAKLGSQSTSPGQFFFTKISIFLEQTSGSEKVLQEADVEILKQTYEQCEGASWTKKWDFDAKTFAGVTFDAEGYVTAINLKSCNVGGTFPNMLLGLPRLKDINLASNRLAGDINSGSDAVAGSTLTSVDISNNKLKGNIGAFVARCPGLTKLEASNNGFGECLPILPSTVKTWHLNNQVLEDTIHLTLSTKPAQLLAQLPQIVNYPMLVPDMYVYWSSNMYTETSTIYLDYNYDSYNLYIGEYREPSGTKATFYFAFNNIEVMAPMRLYYTEGDANFDTVFDVADLQTVVNYIMNRYSLSVFNFYGADFYLDNKINVQDVVLFVDRLMTQPEADTQRIKARVNEETYTCLYVDSEGRIVLENELPVAAFSFTAEGAEAISWSLPEGMFALRTAEVAGGKRTVAYAPDADNCLAPGRHILGTASGASSLAAISLSTPEGTSLPCGREGGITTGIAAPVESALTVRAGGDNIIVGCPASEGAVTVTVCDLAGRTIATATVDDASAGASVALHCGVKGALIVSVSATGYNLTEKIFVR